MSQEYYITYALADGGELARGFGPEGVTSVQRPGEGRRALTLPQAAWEAPLADVADAVRDGLWEQVKAKRAAVIGAGAPTPAGRVQTDIESRVNIYGLVTMAMLLGDDFSESFTNQDDEVAAVNAEQMKAIGLAAGMYVSQAHTRARALRAALDGAETVTALLMLDLDAGWPD